MVKEVGRQASRRVAAPVLSIVHREPWRTAPATALPHAPIELRLRSEQPENTSTAPKLVQNNRCKTAAPTLLLRCCKTVATLLLHCCNTASHLPTCAQLSLYEPTCLFCPLIYLPVYLPNYLTTKLPALSANLHLPTCLPAYPPNYAQCEPLYTPTPCTHLENMAAS